jgi:hypothetical protein
LWRNREHGLPASASFVPATSLPALLAILVQAALQSMSVETRVLNVYSFQPLLSLSIALVAVVVI